MSRMRNRNSKASRLRCSRRRNESVLDDRLVTGKMVIMWDEFNGCFTAHWTLSVAKTATAPLAVPQSIRLTVHGSEILVYVVENTKPSNSTYKNILVSVHGVLTLRPRKKDLHIKYEYSCC